MIVLHAPFISPSKIMGPPERELDFTLFFLILFLAFTFVKGMKGSGSGNPFSVAQYCPAGTPQKSLAQSMKDPRKGLHQSRPSGVPSR